jgi:2-C-methyl-D-erythritol 4-phosphate cytidylyltransferase
MAAGPVLPAHHAVALILAAGAGERLGGPEPKAFALLGGRPLVWYSIEAASLASVGAIVVVLPNGRPGALDRWNGLVNGLAPRHVPIRTVEGGATRQESVRLGLDAVPAEASVVVVHDAARPFAGPGLFDHGIEALRRGGGGIAGSVPVVPCPDTVKRVRDGFVLETVPRDALALVQTPQAFLAGALRDAHAGALANGLAATDDAMLLEAAGYRVATFTGEPGNFKVTTPEDLARAERDLAARPPTG